MGWWARRKYRKNVIASYQRVLSVLPQKDVLTLLNSAYKDLKGAINGFYESGTPVGQVSVLLAGIVVGRTLDSLSPDSRNLALYAWESGNQSNPLTNNLQAILQAAWVECNHHRATYDGIAYEVRAALEGVPEPGRSAYKLGRIINESLSKQGYQPTNWN